MTASIWADEEVFLHGVCGIFALALTEEFGYPINWVLDDEWEEEDDPWHHLVHIYCETPDGALVDVRGVIEDEDEFHAEFEDFVDEGFFAYGLPGKAIRDRIVEDMGEEAFEEAYQGALAIIRKDPARYRG